MFFQDERLIRAIDADRRRASVDAVHRANLPERGPNPFRRALGRSLMAVGSRLAAESPPEHRRRLPARAR